MSLKTRKEIESFGFERCEFNDECDVCLHPKRGSYARMIRHAESDSEVDYYICGKCASKIIEDGLFECAYEVRLTPRQSIKDLTKPSSVKNMGEKPAKSNYTIRTNEKSRQAKDI